MTDKQFKPGEKVKLQNGQVATVEQCPAVVDHHQLPDTVKVCWFDTSRIPWRMMSEVLSLVEVQRVEA